MNFVISHFYNEEYLLPWWLEHHKKIFDYGIIIDYDSTDKSVDIVKSICPDWTVIKSVYSDFNASDLDVQVMGYERGFDGWRIALTTTEFLIGDVASLMANHDFPKSDDPYDSRMHNHYIPVQQMFEWNPEGKLNHDRPLYEQCFRGKNYLEHGPRGCRSLHNHRHQVYQPGRHFYNKSTDDAMILHYSNCIASAEMLQRRLQIQHRIPVSDKQRNFGFQHHNNNHPDGLTKESLHQQLMPDFPLISNCSNLIAKHVNNMHTLFNKNPS